MTERVAYILLRREIIFRGAIRGIQIQVQLSIAQRQQLRLLLHARMAPAQVLMTQQVHMLARNSAVYPLTSHKLQS